MSIKRNNVFSDLNPNVQEQLNLDKISAVSLSHTSKGVLCKWIGLCDGDLLYVKTGKLSYGKFSNLEPLSECIASDIGSLLGLNVIATDCADIDIKGVEGVKDQIATVSYTKSYVGEGEVFYSVYKLEGDGVTYDLLVNKYPQFKEDFNKMILFDFIINNTDRHLNNFGFILSSDSLELKRFSPIFDNGGSLLSDLSEEKLIEYDYKDIDDYSICKPFINKHYKQLALIKELPSVNLDFGRDEIEAVVNNYSLDLSERRRNKMINLIVRRLDYVKHLYGQV